MSRKIIQEESTESQNSIALELDAKGNLKAAVKFYFEDREEWQKEADRALSALRYLMEKWGA